MPTLYSISPLNPNAISVSEFHQKMSQREEEAATEKTNLTDTNPKVEETDKSSQVDTKDVNICEETQIPSENHQEEEIVKKKYGGLIPKKPPLISKDSERAFFDSADWALGKVGAQKSKGPLEALRPKLQPTPNHQRSRSAYARADDAEDGCDLDHSNPVENRDGTLDGGIESYIQQSPDNQNPQK